MYRRTAFVLSLLVCLCAWARPAAAAPIVQIDTPVANASVSSPFFISGWTLDPASTAGTGVGQLHVWAYPDTGASPILIGAAAFMARPDVAAAFGKRFLNSGFWINAALPAGSYRIVLTPWSSLTSNFRPEAAAALSLTVKSSAPIVQIDTPTAKASVSQSLFLSGWTLDLASTVDTGVGQLHAWAYPDSGASPIFVGGMSVVARPDVAAVFGARYLNSGFSINGTLPPGSYRIVLTPWSTLTGTFRPEAAVELPLTVKSPAPIVQIDTPAANASVSPSFFISGWSLDVTSTADTGVGQLHAWAYPDSGASPIFVGATSVVPRPDVAAVFGARYLNAGFWINGTLPPGSYRIVLTPWSTLTGSFRPEAAVVLPLTVKDPAAAPSSSATLRVLQWNTHHGGVGTDGVYDPDRLATWAASVKPDVVMFNEIEKNDYWGNQDQPEVYKALLEQKTGRTWYYVFAQEFGQWSANGKGNLILSRYPINVKDRYELVQNADRSLAMATITVNGRDITLISTHLDPYDQSLRLAQATEVTGWAAAQPENRIITGDMNAWPDQTSIAQFDSLYNDSWSVAAAKGTATAFSGNNGETKSGRIDYIFYSKGASNLSVISSQVIDTRDANGNTPSDHRPVFTIFSVR